MLSSFLITSRFTILKTIKFKTADDLVDLETSEARVMLLYSTTDEAKEILSAAKARGLTGRNYVWIATQSIIGSNPVTPDEFPIGMLGADITFDISAYGSI